MAWGGWSEGVEADEARGSHKVLLRAFLCVYVGGGSRRLEGVCVLCVLGGHTWRSKNIQRW